MIQFQHIQKIQLSGLLATCSRCINGIERLFENNFKIYRRGVYRSSFFGLQTLDETLCGFKAFLKLFLTDVVPLYVVENRAEVFLPKLVVDA